MSTNVPLVVKAQKRFVSTLECYNAWATTYDNDGNVLQLIDDRVFEEIAQPLLNENRSTKSVCCELGCGTGRNTEKILASRWSIIAVDNSQCMMNKAKERLDGYEKNSISLIRWILHDLNDEYELSIEDSFVDAVVCTLVLEHIYSLDRFFQTIYRILKKTKNSWVYLTTMHPNMFHAGSQAGFIIDKTTEERICGISYDHSIDDIHQAAKRNHFVLIQCRESGVENEEHAQQLGSRATKWLRINIHAAFLFRLQ